MSDKIIKNWIALADYDLDTAGAMLKTGRYLYVAFCCQQAVEKLLKAIYVKQTGQTPPYIHSLMRLIEAANIKGNLDSGQHQFLEDLNSYYIENRYTEELASLTARISMEQTELIYNKTKEFTGWLKTQLK
jgi:HEPN domain-containing protein